MKHYRLKAGSSSSEPRHLFEVRLDLHDVRSGYSETRHLLLSAPSLDDPELGWTPDMVSELAWEALEEIDAPRPAGLGGGGDDKVNDFLLRHFRPQIWCNPALRLYSVPGESRADFESRCREAVAEEHADELQKMREIYLHRFLEQEQRALAETGRQEWGPDLVDQKTVATREVFSRIREDLGNWFSRRALSPIRRESLNWAADVHIETAERLQDLKQDFIQRYNEIHEAILGVAAQVEAYRVPLTYSQVGVVGRAVVWI